MECGARSVLEITKILSKIPQTLNNMEITVDYMLGMTDGYHQNFIERRVAPCIADINDHIQALKFICEKIKSEMDGMLEQNVQKENRLKTVITSLHIQIDDKRIDMTQLKDEKERTEDSVNNAKTQLENAKKALFEAKRNLVKAKDAQAGVGLSGTPILVVAPFFIPFFGPVVAAGAAIVGSSMVIASLTVMQTDIDEKKGIASSALDIQSGFENRLNDINKKLKNLQGEIETCNATERRLKTESDGLSSSKENIKTLQKKMSKFLKMFNTGFHRLTVASGQSRVLHSSSVYAYNLNHLKPLVEAFCDSFLLFAETKMFESLNVFRNMDLYQIRRIRNKVKNKQNIIRPQLAYNEGKIFHDFENLVLLVVILFNICIISYHIIIYLQITLIF